MVEIPRKEGFAMKKSMSTTKIVFIAMLAALVYVVTMFRFPLLGSKVHLGNAVCLLSGLLMGPAAGGLAAGLGSALNDALAGGYDFIQCMITFVSKFAMAWVCGKIAFAGGREAKSHGQNIAAAVIGADTMVLNAAGELLGKPRDAEDARKMLTELSGGMNIVYTGVCVMREGRAYCGVEETRVFFRTLEPWEIEHYIASGEPMDKAGAYGIQGRGALLVQRIEGDYFNVVGLPLVLTAQLLGEAGYRIWSGGAQ